MRLPLFPTLIVGLAMAAMVGLGLWQLDRRGEKAALIARLTANRDLPVMAFPDPPVGDEHLFRRAGLMCLDVASWREQAGRDAGGKSGWRHLADCRTGAEGMSVLVDMGVSSAPGATPAWKGGKVTGTVTYAPDSTPLLAGLFGKRPPRNLMLVADTPAPGLSPSAPPDPASVPNNHLAYAVQWFLFAGVAGVIYLLALRFRRRTPASPAPPQS